MIKDVSLSHQIFKMFSVSKSNSVFKGVHQDYICSASALLLYSKKAVTNAYLGKKKVQQITGKKLIKLYKNTIHRCIMFSIFAYIFFIIINNSKQKLQCKLGILIHTVLCTPDKWSLPHQI